MLLLTTQALPQMREFRHPNLGRLLTPRHFARLQDTRAEGCLLGADNDCFHSYAPEAIARMFAAVAPIPSVLARIRTAWPQMNPRAVEALTGRVAGSAGERAGGPSQPVVGHRAGRAALRVRRPRALPRSGAGPRLPARRGRRRDP